MQSRGHATQVGIILTVRFLPMPNVTRLERLLVRAIDGIPNYYQVCVGEGVEKCVGEGAGGSSWGKERQGLGEDEEGGWSACLCGRWMASPITSRCGWEEVWNSYGNPERGKRVRVRVRK